MNKESNTYIIGYATIMIVLVAIVLSATSLALSDRKKANVEVEKQLAILSSIGLGADAGNVKDKTAYVQQEYRKYITDSYVVDSKGNRVEGVDAFSLLDKLKAAYAAPDESRVLPVFIARMDDGRSVSIFPVYGAGLWGPIWGYVALDADWSTIYGIKFDHKGETPGLGAEIAEPAFAGQFGHKSIFRGSEFVSVNVIKGAGASAGNDNAVDAISGGTITSNAVGSMLYECLKDYLPLIEKERARYQAAERTESEFETTNTVLDNE